MLTVGEILKNERLKKKLSLNDLEKITKIRRKFLEAIEKNNWEFFSSKTYIEGIIKNYSLALGLSYQKILPFFRRDYQGKEDFVFKKKLTQDSLIAETKKINLTLAILIFFIFGIYFGYQFKKFLSPPTLKILSPTKDYFVNENKIILKVKVEKDTLVKIYNQKVYQDESGIISYELPLKKGKNEVLIQLTGANGKTTTIKKIFYKK